MTITIPRRPSWAIVVLVGLLAFFVPRIADADHSAPGRTLTGCLRTDGTLVKLAVGSAPDSACSSGQQEVHIADGDVTAVVAGAGLSGGASRGNATLALKPSYRLPQGCATNQVGKWSGSSWVCDTTPTQTLSAGGSGGAAQPVPILDPHLGLHCILSLFGTYPTSSGEPLVGEIKWVPYTTIPSGWVRCDGQLLSIAENETLFSLIGTGYGGDGQETFAVPDLRGRVMRGVSADVSLAEEGGALSTTLTKPQMPPHAHGIP